MGKPSDIDARTTLWQHLDKLSGDHIIIYTHPHNTGEVDPMLVQCWASGLNGGPAFMQTLGYVSF